MARVLKPGDVIKSYRVEKEANRGAMAMAYLARNQADERVFMKVYQSPSPDTPWFPQYVTYQQQIIERVQSSGLDSFVVRPIDVFQAPLSKRDGAASFYIQIFEFVSDGKDLEGMLQDPSVTWDRRLIWSKVIMGSIAQLHKQQIVHCDLKPANLFLIEAPDISIGYRLKVIDIDFAILADKQAPWHGIDGYVGTDGYRSPEHIRKGVPSEKSDIFTCGLILCELLADAHPYRSGAQSVDERSLAHDCTPPTLMGTLPGGNNDEVAQTLHRMLSPAAADRPAAQEVLTLLNREGTAKPTPSPPGPLPADTSSAALTLEFEGGTTLEMNITTVINQRLVKGVGEDAKYWDTTEQFSLQRRSDGWYIAPSSEATNDTLVNAEGLVEAQRLQAGDLVGVGSVKKGIVKTPARVRFGGP